MAKHEPMSREEIKAPIIAGRGVKVGGGVEGKRGECSNVVAGQLLQC